MNSINSGQKEGRVETLDGDFSENISKLEEENDKLKAAVDHS